MKPEEAILMMRNRIDTASEIAGKGTDGKAFEDMEMAILALKEIQQYHEISTVEDFVNLKKGAAIMSDLYKFGYTLYETIKTMRDVIDTGNHDRMFLDTYYWLKMLSEYREIGTVEEFREAVANKKKCEKQWHNDMENPLEPIKVYSALKSEILKLELRIKNRPKDISILDYTVIAALQKVLKNNLEGMEDE